MNDDIILNLFDGNIASAISGWTQARVTRGIERMPADFDVSMSERFPGADQIIAKPGMKCTIDIGEDRVMSGYVDRVINAIGPGQHPVRISGRGYCQDLVDCSAVWQGGQFLNQNVLQIAQAVAKPFGIEVICDEPGAPFAQICMTPGETPFAMIFRLCRIVGLLCYEDERGALVMSRAARDIAAGGLSQAGNIENATLMMGMDQRFSDYTVIQQGLALFSDVLGSQSLDVYTAKDPLVKRFRPKYIPVENGDADNVTALARARWEMNRRLGQSHVLSASVDSWRNPSGELWRPNALTPIDLPALKLTNTSWLISEVTYSVDDNGKHAQLVVMPKEAFGVEPINYSPIPADIAAALS